MRAALLFIALLSWAGATARGADSPGTLPSVPPSADVQELVMLAPGQPLVVRLHIQLDGQPYQSTWGDYLWERFSQADTNADGVLDNDEFQPGDWQALVGQGRDAAGRMTGQRGATSFLDLDDNPQDEAITFTELVEHLGDRCFTLSSGGGNQTFVTASPAAAPSAPDVRDALLMRLDGDNNGQLARDEVSAALGQLYRFDLNEDELLTDLELRTDGNPFVNRFVSLEGSSSAQASIALAPIPGAKADAWAHAVFLNYDLPQLSPDAKQPANGDGQLSPQELRIAPEQFASADGDSNGTVSEAEFVAWLTARAIDVELSVNLDADVAADERVRIAPASARAASTAAASPSVAVETKAGKLTLRLGSCELVVSATGATRWDKQRASYESLFKRFDADQNGYLDEQEARNQIGGGRGQFTRIDTDRDGKIFLEEYLRFHESTQKLTQRRVTASVADQGSRLLEIIDANANGQLSIRELRAVPSLVASWDANGDGQVAPDELPRRYQIQISPGAGGTINGVLAVPVAFSGPMSTAAKLTGKGPDWFQRMDRNGDEDLSRREFLGSRAAFGKLDADGDGLVDLKEAEAASANQ